MLFLRLLIAAQLVGVTLVGLLTRGTIAVDPEFLESVIPNWVGQALFLVVFLAALGSPFVVFRSVVRLRLPATKSATIVGIELALVFAFLLAILPGFQ